MADLLTDPTAVKASWRQMAADDTTLPTAPKVIDPNAQAKLAARDKAADPFAGLEPVSAPDPFSGLEEVKTADPFAGLQQADSLDLKDTKALVDDDTFRPADYLAANPNIRTDAEKSKKLIDVYRARQIRGLEAGKVLKAAVTEAPGIVAKTVKGARDLGARVIESTIQPAATSILSAFSSPEEKSAIMAEQGKEQLKAAGEVTAGTESAITGLSQLGQQGARKLFGKSPEKMTDSELLDQLYLDSEFSKTTKEVSEGKGDVAKAAGLDADTLAKNGVTLDKDAIENLSLVDPLTLVATAGAFKVVGLGGKVIATAATRAGAQTVINGLAKVAQTVGAKGVEAVGKTASVIGKTGQAIAERIPAKSVGFVLGATKTGTLQGGAVGAAAGEAAKRIGAETAGALAKRGEALADIGRQLSPGAARSAGLQRILSLPTTPLGKIATSAAKGAVQGAVTAVPLAAAADESQTAGALLGGGAALGAIHGTVTGGKAAVAETVAKNYLDPHNIPFEPKDSPAYGLDANLDATHESAFKSLPVSEQNAVNNFREAVRAGGGEIYVQDSSSYLARIKENLQAENGGQPLSPSQEAQAALYADTHAFFDGQVGDRRVVFLNSDAKGLPHDAGHLFQSLLSPENQNALRESALSSYSPEQLQAFKDEYARRIGEPDYFNKLGEEANNKAADELIAENFGQLFQNKTFADLSAPRPFLKKLGDTAVKAAEALGIDLTAGRTTADLGATPSFRLQDLLRNAAQDVLTRKDSGKLTPAKPAAAPVTPAAVTPATSTPVVPVTPAAVTPAAPAPVTPTTPAAVTPKTAAPLSTAKNIRTERTAQSDFASKRAEETGIAEAQKATEANPEVRKVVDDIAKSMEAGNPVLEVEHRGIVSERGPANPEGRTSRRGTQEAGYEELERLQIENRAEAPADIVDLHQKTFVPVRFTTQGGKPTLIAMSLDKVIANVRRVVKDAVANKAESLLPYPVENGKLTDAGWKQAVEDVKAYSENQSNGFRGDGKPLVRPTEDIGVSIPEENPNYTPKPLSEGAMNFANLVQGLNPPETGRVQKGLTPGNVKGQMLAEVNAKQPMTPSVIKPENVTKQAFKGFEPRTVKETNPLRNELAAKGVKVRELTEVTERLAVEDIKQVSPRTDINFKAPVTDTIRAGFLPKDRPVAETISSVEKTTPDEWSKSFGPQNSLTREAFEVGLKLTSPDELTALRDAQARASDAFKVAMEKFKAGDESAMAEAYAQGSKGQFFREAYEAATDTGSAAGSYGWRKAFPEGKPPFAAQSLADRLHQEAFGYSQEKPKFLPRTEAGKKVAENGIEFELTGEKGNRTIRIKKGGKQIGDVTSSSSPFTGDLTKATIAGTNVQKSLRGQGIGEAAYRELLTQLKEDGVTEVSGMTVSGAPLAIREKVFGKGSTKVTDVGGSDRGLIPVEQAISELNDGGLGFEAKNEITSESKFLPKGDKPIRDIASEYAKTAKIPYTPHETYAPLNPKLGEKLADFYDSAKSDPANPEVQKSYRALADETMAQYEAMRDAGYTIEPFKGEGEPYKNSDEAIADIRDNKHLYFLKTEGNFSGQQDNPMLTDSGISIDGERLLVNDVFRAVHDFFGHGKEGYQFGPRGEFNAWRAHSEMYSPEAQGALAAETLAQNSWVNFGKQVRGKEVALKDRPFAEQKAVIVPDELIQEAKSGESERAFLPKFQLKESDKPTLAEDAGIRNYWVSPKGEFFYPGADHRDWARERLSGLSDNEPKTTSGRVASEEVLKKLGWLRISVEREGSGIFIDGNSPTPAQESALDVWKSAHPDQEFIPTGGLRGRFLPKKRNVEVSDVQKRDDQNRPLTRDGLVDYEKLYAEMSSKKKKDEAAQNADLAKRVAKGAYKMPENAPKAGPATGWILPDGTFVPLDANYHEQFLANNSADLNKKFGTKLGSTPDVNERFDALNKGFVRVRYTPADGAMRVELAASNWNPKTKRSILNQIEAQSENIDRLYVALADKKGGVADSITENVASLEGAEKFSALSDAVSKLRGTGPAFLPKGGTKEFNDYVAARIRDNKQHPEALPLDFRKDEAGNYVAGFNGEPTPIVREYELLNTPLAKKSKGKTAAETEEKFTDTLAKGLEKEYAKAKKNPEIEAGETWYSTTRESLSKLLGDDTKLFAELLGATSPQTAVGVNFGYALDAYNQFKKGAYDKMLDKYREGKQSFAAGELDEFTKDTGKSGKKATYDAFMGWWIDKHNLIPTKESGKRFGLHSKAVLKVLDGSWLQNVKGPKTPNFTGNLTGSTFEATIDVWAMRALHRLANEGNPKRWRIQPGNETGVTDTDFFMGQKAFRKAAEKLGIQPDALQAILWFNEKDHWTKKGWTSAIGKAKADFNSLLQDTERTPEGYLQRIDKQLSLEDITSKK